MEAEALLEVLAGRVKERRAARGWTLRELAARSGLSPRFVAHVESGRGNISVKSLAGLARALGTTPAALLALPERRAELPVIALLGLRGAGKSTVGRRLARRLRVPFEELDARIEGAAGLTLGEVFALHGEAYYRRLERETLEEILGEGRSLVLATGGGLPTSPETYRLLRQNALTVWLRASPEDHWNRVIQQGDRRPMADRPQAMAELRRLLASRQPLYAEATITVDTSRRTVEAAVDRVVSQFRGRVPKRAEPQRTQRSQR